MDPEELQIPKSTALEIYEQMEEDLEEAVLVLPEIWEGDDYGRITRGAANALLARIHLFFYGYHNVQEAIQKAREATASIINSGQYSLFPDYEALFTPENEDVAEIIWSVRFSSDLSGDNGEGFSFSNNAVPVALNLPLQNFVDAFYCIDGLPIDQSPLYDPAAYWENRDPRWDANIVYEGEKWLDNRPPYNIGPANRRTGYSIDKYLISNNEGALPNNGGQDWYIFRYADILLMHAEALIETNQNLGEARNLIDQVRQRVNMPTIAQAEEANGTVINQTSLREILRHERRVELAFENTRFVDLKRWGTMQEAYERSGQDTKPRSTNPVLQGVTYQGDRSIILPSPQQELDINRALEQHPAW